MNIRTYKPGDEAVQAEIYNQAAGHLPRFKPAKLEEMARRCQAADFDPSTRLYAEEGGKLVGYVSFHRNGRVGCPWCLKGHESVAEPLFRQALDTLAGWGIRTAIAAYRTDWPGPQEFLKRHGFRQVREMVNYVLELSDLPTRTGLPISPTLLRREDLPAVLEMGGSVLRLKTVMELEKYFFENSYFSPDAVHVLRHKKDQSPTAVAVLIQNYSFANPREVDASMPCFRLGAFGSEGMQVKRINGMFSVLARNDGNLLPQAATLLEFAALQLENDNMDTLAAQVPSDATHLVRFYQGHFNRQGNFPVYEKDLTSG